MNRKGNAMPVVCVGIACQGADGALLLVRRSKPPRAGAWSLPGGRVEPTEPSEQTARRELKEETGLVAPGVQLIGVHEFFGEGHHLVVLLYWAREYAGIPVAAGDALSIGWWTSVAERGVPHTEGLLADAWASLLSARRDR